MSEKHEVECLECSKAYFVDKDNGDPCPHCGNDDLLQTVFIVPKEDRELEDEDLYVELSESEALTAGIEVLKTVLETTDNKEYRTAIRIFEEMISYPKQNGFEMTEDFHIKAECPKCEGLTHTYELEENKQCDLCIEENN